MDLVREANRLRLDLLAVRACEVLARGGIPHVLLKGPSTALWLYDPPRSYNDVDLMVPLSRVMDAAAALAEAGVAAPSAGRVGEEAEHSYLLISAEGFEIDLHIALPTVHPDGDRIWDAMSAHVEPLELDVGVVPALDEAGRCLVIALHALNSGRTIPQTKQDLQRAREIASSEVWRQAGELAKALNIEDLFEAGRNSAFGDRAAASTRTYLYAVGAPNSAFALQRMAEAPRRALPGVVLREIFPSRGFMRRAYGHLLDRPFGMPLAYFERWRSIAVALPRAVRIWRTARRQRS